ncbi:MAG: replication factor C large subunit [Candidatus Nanoarchaeia archaeon]
MSDIWIRKYAPKNSSELVGHKEEIAKLKKLISSHEIGKKPIFLYGGVGNGKTSTVYAIANELDLELIEINASDTRNSDAITSLLSGVINQGSLFGTSKVVLVDEIDGLSGTKDRGALPSMMKIIPNSKYPVVLIAHDAYSDKLKDLRKTCELIEFKQLDNESIILLLKRICKEEKITYNEEALSQLARLSAGDARAAINDLQTVVIPGEKITSEHIRDIGERNSTTKIEDSLKRIFKTTDPAVALGAFDDVDEDIDKVFLWVEENIPKEYLDPAHLSSAFDNLSMADVFYGRIKRWQYYRFYVYCYTLMSAGIALSKDKKYASNHTYQPTSRLLKIWIYNNANAKKKAISQKIGALTHTSTKRAYRDTVPFLQAIFKKDKKMAANIAHEAGLIDEEITWLKTK